MGKSRLLAEFVRDARRDGHLVAFGECQSFGTRTTYAVWGEIWRALLAVPETMTEAEQLQALEQALTDIDPALLERAPLLDAVLGLPIPDTELTASFDAKLRKTSLESLLADCLRALTRTDAKVIVLEDCHWLDPLSRDLLDVLARAVDGSHLLLVLAYRPEGLGVSGLVGLEEVALDTLGEVEMTEVVRGKLGQLVAERGGGAAVSARGGRRALAGEPVLRGGAPELRRRARGRPCGRGRAPLARAARKPPQPRARPHRHAERGPAADAQGRERRRPGLPGAGDLGCLPGSRVARPTSARTC